MERTPETGVNLLFIVMSYLSVLMWGILYHAGYSPEAYFAVMGITLIILLISGWIGLCTIFVLRIIKEWRK